MTTATNHLRIYQSELCAFMILFQGISFLDSNDRKVPKHKVFDRIWDNHLQMTPEILFKVPKDIDCQLLQHNHHKDYKCVPREFLDFNETEAMNNATDMVCLKMAATISRKIKTENIPIIDLIPLISNAIKQAYNHHADMEKEIEQSLAAV